MGSNSARADLSLYPNAKEVGVGGQRKKSGRFAYFKRRRSFLKEPPSIYERLLLACRGKSPVQEKRGGPTGSPQVGSER